jgi:hypothetical protein
VFVTRRLVTQQEREPEQPGSLQPLDVVQKAVLKSKGVNDVHVRADGRVLITAGWDGKYVVALPSYLFSGCSKTNICFSLFGQVR